MALFPVRPVAPPEPPPYPAARVSDRIRNLARGRQILANALDSLGRAGRPALHRIVDGAADALGSIANRLVFGSIGVADWFLASLDQIVVRHFAGLLALEPRPSPDALDVLEPAIDRQAGFLSRFRAAILSGVAKMGDALIARARMYGEAVWGVAVNVQRRLMVATRTMERRNLDDGSSAHCHTCPALAAMGWVEAGTLPDIGESECGARCRCWFSYK